MRIERGLAPVSWYLIRNRAAVLQGAVQCGPEDVSATGSQTASTFVELGALLRLWFVIGSRSEPVGPTGALEPWGVTAGKAFAMVTRSSYFARLRWFQKLDWWRVSCMLRGLDSRHQENKSVQRSRPGFVEIADKSHSGLRRAVRCFGGQYSHIPVQPGGKSCVCGANSFAALPMFEG